ncbi:MAG: hypothetical protein KDB80_13985, partial [Planctomycetes bacterium]|nr:hypothetical protein [Planctomycetota bacterium]
VVTPPHEPRHITVGTKHCVDPGDSDEAELFDTRATRVVRYVDGREYAREVEPGGHASYRLPLPSTAAVAEVEIDVAGALRVSSGVNVLHEDLGDDFAEPRTISIRVSDPRLWQRDRALLLRLEAGDANGCSVAQIRFAAEGHAPPVTDLVSESIHEADSRIRIAVVPLEFSDNPLRTSRSALERVFFGDTEYRLTPEPNARLTSGSVAQLVQRASGGISELRGVVEAPLRIETPSSAAREEILPNLLPTIGATLATGSSGGRPPDVIVAVYGGAEHANLRGPASLELDGTEIPIILLPEQSADGSILSSGTALLALLDELYDFEDLGTPEAGNFGELALSATDGGHVPARIAGINLVRSGWAQFLRADPSLLDGDGRLSVEVAPLARGRSVLRLPSAGMPDRGDLFIENCGQTSSDPWASNSGALLYRAFPTGAEPWIRVGAEQIRAHYLRLSADRPEWRTPFHAATSKDLFRASSLVDGTATVTLATLHGEEFWALKRIRTDADGTTRLWLDYLARHLLDDRSVAWQRRDGQRFVPVSRHPATERASVVTDPDGVTIQAASGIGATVRAVVPPPRGDRPLRLFGRLADGAESGLRGSIERDGSRVLEFDVDEHAQAFQLDLPANVRGPVRIDFVRAREGSGSCRLTELLTVPRSVPRFPIRLPDLEPVTLSDGIAYAASRITLGEDGDAHRSIPIVIPERDAVLLLCAGVPRGSSPIRLDATISGNLLIEDFEFGASESRQPIPLLITAIPESCHPGVESLELKLTGRPGSALHLVQIAISD